MTGKIVGEQDEREGAATMQELIYQAAKAVTCWGYAAIACLPVVVWGLIR